MKTAQVRSIFAVAAIVVCGTAAVPRLGAQPPATASPSSAVVTAFLAAHCLACHDAASAEGEREFETFTLPLSDESSLITADEIIDQLTLGTMPPPDEDQPGDDQRLAVLEALRGGIDEARERLESNGGRTVLRRLSHREYENTLATLMDRRVDTLGLTADFPKESSTHRYDTVGSSLVTSGFLLDQYFQAADRLIETRLGQPPIEPQHWHFKDNFVQYEELNNSHRSVFKFDYLCIYEQPNTDTRQGGYGHIEDFLQGVPASGLYDVGVYVRAMHRDTHYDPAIFRIDLTEPFELAVVPGDVRKGHIHYPQAIEPILAQTIVPDDDFEWITMRVWLEAGQTPRFIFPNGPYESRASVLKLNDRYKDELQNKANGVSRTNLLRVGALPHIRIDEIKIDGPIVEDGGRREELAIFGDDGFQPEAALEQLYDFAARAYRRPLGDEDRQRIREIYNQRIDEDATARQAALDSVKLILCSPSFLYLHERTAESERWLASHDLAARLSYALWAAPPDEVLRNLADRGDLSDPEVLNQQIERMLNDPRSEQFVNAFLDSWLRLRDIGSLPPPREGNQDYYGESLPDAMKEEARRFFNNLLASNGPATDLLDSDYTFVDKRLAKLYGLPEAETLRRADGFVRVGLKPASHRGGVLGMAGVLTASANGVDTSPVTRGVWVLENLLGMPPPPPPDEVPSIDADVSGSTTIRERLELHRQDAACNVCHRKIDPMGFALESYDPIGRWRERYPRVKGKPGPKVDPHGELPTGQSYANITEFKQWLASSRGDLFQRHLTTQLLTYATGRHMESTDRYAIDDIVQSVRRDGGGLRTMVTAVLASDVFRSR